MTKVNLSNRRRTNGHSILEAVEVRRLLSTVTVDTLADETVANANTSLREAIANADAGDTIAFKVGLTGQVTLGGSPLQVNKNLVISGPGVTVLKISGDDISRVIEVGPGAGVRISGLTLTRGRAAFGGGIYNRGALAMNDCVVSNNVAAGADGKLSEPPLPSDVRDGGDALGGGIYNTGTVNLSDVMLSGNLALGGDGTWDSSVSPVRAGAGGNAFGGAVFSSAAAGPVRIGKTTFTGNQAVGGRGAYAVGGAAAGGALYHLGAGGLVTATDSTFADNKAVGGSSVMFESLGIPGGDARGGAISNSGAGVDLAYDIFSNNAAIGGKGSNAVDAGGTGGNASGGALHSLTSLLIRNSTLTGNSATGGEGGPTDWRGFQGEGGDATGGAVEAFANLSVTYSKLTDNRATGGNGYGVWFEQPGPLPDGSAASGGAITVHGDATVISSTLSNNTAVGGGTNVGGAASGGAILLDGDSLVISSSTLADNQALASPHASEGYNGADASGGAVATRGDADVIVTWSTLSGNRAVAGAGGESWGYYGGDEGPAGAGGTASGGAIALSAGSNARLNTNTLFGNAAVGGRGGSPHYDGGDGGNARGGAINVPAASASLETTNCTIAGNTVIAGPPGSSDIHTGTPGQGYGGGVSGSGNASEGAIIFANTIIATNTAQTGPDVSAAVASGGFNLIGKTNGSTGWINTDLKGTALAPLDPRLGPLAGNGGPTRTMAPRSDSPVIDAGNAPWHSSDQRGEERPRDIRWIPNAANGSDIGAVELQALAPQPQAPYLDFVIGPDPLTMQAEHFDDGGEGVAYHDTDAYNWGGHFRNYSVDVQPTGDTGGGYNVGWTRAGEWLEYTVQVQTAGKYDLAFRVASKGAGGAFHLALDGNDVTGPLAVPDTGGWQNWTTVTRSGVSLPAGKHVLRLAMTTNGALGYVGNFNSVAFTAASSASVTTVNTSTAAHVRDGPYRGANYGASVALEVKKSSIGYNRESYLKFDLAGVPTIANARLRLYGALADALTPSVQLGVFASPTTSWTEAGVTWNSKPATAASPLATTTVSGTTKKWYEIDLTSYLTAEKAAGRNVVTLALKSLTAASTLSAFNADEVTNGPHLVVTK